MVFSTQFDARDHFNPRSPRGERLGLSDTIYGTKAFQSTLSEGRATTLEETKYFFLKFQSTLSEGRATANISKMLRGGLDRFPNF